MPTIAELGRRAWRKWVVDGVEGTGANKPTTDDIFPFVDAVDQELTSLKSLVEAGVTFIDGGWQTATAYSRNDVVSNDGVMYRATADHTSGASTEPGTGGSWETRWEIFLGEVLVDDVQNSQLANVATARIKGRVTAGTGSVEDLTGAQVRTIINVADGATANSADATLLARANHTGTQSADTITDGSTNKAFTATLKTKLDAVEALADVTDAANVAAAINGASAKATPVAADKVGLIDSEASNALKTLTWSALLALISANLSASVAFTGVISPTQITADENNYAPTGFETASIIRLSSNAARIITGIQGGASGRIMVLANAGSFDITLARENASSLTTRRFAFMSDFVLRPGQTVMLVYDSTVSRWRLVTAQQEGLSEPETTVASASTTDIGASRTERVTITGPNTIISFGTKAKQKRWVRFQEDLTLTHHATTLILATGASRAIKTGDTMLVASDASGNWRELAFCRPSVLETLDSLQTSITELTSTVADVDSLLPVLSVDPQGASLIERSSDGRIISRIDGDGEVSWDGNEQRAGVYFDDADGGKLKAVGGKVVGVREILSAVLAAQLKRGSIDPVRGGWRIPGQLRGTPHMVRVNDGAVAPDDGRTIYVLIFWGQSNNQEAVAGEDLLRTTHPYPDRLLVPATTLGDIHLSRSGSTLLTRADITGFSPLLGTASLNGGGTSQSEIAASTFARLIGDKFDGWIPPIVAFTVAKGGTPIDEMFEGGGANIHENVAIISGAIVEEAAKLGYRVNFLAAIGDQGENNTTASDLGEQHAALVSGFNDVLKPLSGQLNDILAFTNQTSSFRTATGEISKVNRYRSDGDLILAAPRYAIAQEGWRATDDPGDGPYLHMFALGHFRLGELVGHALFDQFCRGGHLPLLLNSVTSASTTLTMTFNQDVEINTSLVEAYDQYGLVARKGSSPSADLVGLSGWSVAGPVITATLAESMPAGSKLLVGITEQDSPRSAAAIPRLNICSATELGKSQLDGRSLRRWAMHDYVSINP